MLITPQPLQLVATNNTDGTDNGTTVQMEADAPLSSPSIREAALNSYHLAANETTA
jgi:hypothetical protein